MRWLCNSPKHQNDKINTKPILSPGPPQGLKEVNPQEALRQLHFEITSLAALYSKANGIYVIDGLSWLRIKDMVIMTATLNAKAKQWTQELKQFKSFTPAQQFATMVLGHMSEYKSIGEIQFSVCDSAVCDTILCNGQYLCLCLHCQ